MLLSKGLTTLISLRLWSKRTAVGLALEGMQRHKVIISTKTGTHPERRGDYSWDRTMWSVDNSLRLLKTDYIALLLIHQDLPAAVLAPRGALEALEHLKDQGVIKAMRTLQTGGCALDIFPAAESATECTRRCDLVISSPQSLPPKWSPFRHQFGGESACQSYHHMLAGGIDAHGQSDAGGHLP